MRLFLLARYGLVAQPQMLVAAILRPFSGSSSAKPRRLSKRAVSDRWYRSRPFDFPGAVRRASLVHGFCVRTGRRRRNLCHWMSHRCAIRTEPVVACRIQGRETCGKLPKAEAHGLCSGATDNAVPTSEQHGLLTEALSEQAPTAIVENICIITYDSESFT